jgi:hypothetical protein
MSERLTDENIAALQRIVDGDDGVRPIMFPWIDRALSELKERRALDSRDFVDVVFDGPPSHESGRFVETEDERGHSISVGEWIDRGDGLFALRIPTRALDLTSEEREALAGLSRHVRALYRGSAFDTALAILSRLVKQEGES